VNAEAGRERCSGGENQNGMEAERQETAGAATATICLELGNEGMFGRHHGVINT
jgi:hypothetical protein